MKAQQNQQEKQIEKDKEKSIPQATPMKKYQGLLEAIQAIEKPIKKIMLIGVLANIATLVLGGSLHLIGRKKDNLTPFSACEFGMRSIFNNNPDKDLINKKVLADLRGKSFMVDEITLVKLVHSYSCDVVVKDPRGFRSYQVTLEKNPKFDRLYRIYDVKEQKLTSPYQWEEGRSL